MRRRSANFAMVALVGATLCATAHGQQAANATSPLASPRSSIGRKVELAGVPNFGEATTTLYRGGQPTEQGFTNLAKMGVSIVVDLLGAGENERQEVTKLGMQYVPIPWHCFRPEDPTFARFLTLLRENQDKKIFIHCRLGADRSGMMIAAYRMAEQDWTAEEARKEMEAFGAGRLHRLMCPGLSAYEASFPERYKTSSAFQSLRPSDHTAALP